MDELCVWCHVGMPWKTFVLLTSYGGNVINEERFDKNARIRILSTESSQSITLIQREDPMMNMTSVGGLSPDKQTVSVLKIDIVMSSHRLLG